MTMLSDGVRRDVLEPLIARFLKRRNLPDRLDSQEAQDDELDDLVLLARTYAPPFESTRDLEAWWDSVRMKLLERLRHTVWPSTGELKAAIDAELDARSEARKTELALRPVAQLPVRVGRGDGGALRDEAIHAAQQIRAGRAVSEFYLFGAQADEMVRQGLVTYDEIEPYREYMRRAWRDLYGEERAQVLEEERRTGRYRLGTPVDGAGAGTFGQLGRAATEAPQRPRYQPTPEQLRAARERAGTIAPRPPEERLPERDEAAEAELYDGDPDAWREGLDRHSASPGGAAA